MISDFVHGARCFLRGFSMLRSRGVKRFCLIPLTINTLIFAIAIYIGVDRFERLLNRILPSGDGFLVEISRIFLWVFFALTVLICIFFTFGLLANLIGSPFNGLLSAMVEKHFLGKMVVGDDRAIPFLKTVVPSMVGEAKKLALIFLLSLVLLLFSLIPFINVVFPFIWVFFTSWALALEYISYPMENQGHYFSDVRMFIRGKKALSLGFGAAVTLATIIPLLNFVVMPAAVAGATILYVEENRKGKGSPPQSPSAASP